MEAFKNAMKVLGGPEGELPEFLTSFDPNEMGETSKGPLS